MSPVVFRRILAAFLLVAPSTWAADSSLLDWVIPQSKGVFGVHVRQIVTSPMMQSALADAKAVPPELQKLFAAAGFDPFNDIEEVMITTSGAAKSPQALIAVRGTFDVARLAAGAANFEGVPYITTGQKGAGVVAFPDSSTALVGELPQVQAAISRRRRPALIEPSLAAKIGELRTRYDLWGVATAPMGGLAGDLSASPQAQAMNSVDQFQFGMTLSHGLELTAEVETRTAEDARKLADSLRLFEAMMQQSRPSGAKPLDVTLSGRTLKVAIAVSEEEMKKAIESRRGAFMQQASAVGSSPAAASQRQPAPNRMAGYSDDTVLVITGSAIDGGTQVTTQGGETRAVTLQQP